jgi:hypothetical protein
LASSGASNTWDLADRRRVARNHPSETSAEVVEKILHRRRAYQTGRQLIVWYLERYRDIETSDGTACHTRRRRACADFPAASPR